MSETKRQKILARISTLISAIPDIHYVEINRMTVVDVDNVPFPAVFIFSARESFIEDTRATIGYENYLWQINLEVWGENVDMETLLGKIHVAMFEDYTFRGNAQKSWRSGVDFWAVDPERHLSAMLIDYTIIYRHPVGNPYG